MITKTQLDNIIRGYQISAESYRAMLRAHTAGTHRVNPFELKAIVAGLEEAEARLARHGAPKFRALRHEASRADEARAAEWAEYEAAAIAAAEARHTSEGA